MSEHLSTEGDQEPQAQETAAEFSAENTEASMRDLLTREFEGGEMPQAVFVLSGGIVEDKSRTGDPNDDGYKSPSYRAEETDAHGFITGGKARVIAAAEIAKRFSEPIIVATSQVEQDRPTHASVQKQELLQRDVPEDRIILEENSVNTITELTELVKLAVANDWKEIVAITSDYHLPRCKAMWEELETIINYDDPEFREAIQKFHESGAELSFAAAEEILELVSSKYARLFEEVRKTDSFKGRLAAEAKGLQDLRDGKYRVWNKPEQLPPKQ